jgi:hypothetical protein
MSDSQVEREVERVTDIVEDAVEKYTELKERTGPAWGIEDHETYMEVAKAAKDAVKKLEQSKRDVEASFQGIYNNRAKQDELCRKFEKAQRKVPSFDPNFDNVNITGVKMALSILVSKRAQNGKIAGLSEAEQGEIDKSSSDCWL